MKIRSNFKKKLLFGFISVIVVMGMTSVVSYFMLRTSIHQLDRMVESNIVANNIINSAAQNIEILSGYIADLSVEKKQDADVEIAQMYGDVETLRSYAFDDNSKIMLDSLYSLVSTYEETMNDMFSKIEKSEFSLASSLRDELRQKADFIQSEVKLYISQELNAQRMLKDELNRNVDTVGISVIAAILLISLIALFIVIRFSNKVGNAVSSITHAVGEVAEGNLKIEPVHASTNDEISLLAQYFNQMTDHLRNLIGNIQLNGMKVAQSAEVLMSGEEQNAKAMEQVAVSISQMSQGASEQAALSQNTDQIVTHLFEINETIMGDLFTVAEASMQANVAAVSGSREVELLYKQMKEISDKMNASQEVTEALRQRSTVITKIVETITTISKETNMLALNASIEAARAGGHGRGFAVVASEIQKLADGASRAAREVSDILAQIDKEIEMINQSMHQSVHEVEHGAVIMNRVFASFDDIVRSSEHANAQNQAIGVKIENMVKEFGEVKKMSAMINSVSKQTLISSQEIAAAAEEQSAGQEEMLASVTTLFETSGQLSEMIKQFKI